MATYYVATNGSSSNDGTDASPWSLSYALNSDRGLGGGDTVIVKAGDYSITSPISIPFNGSTAAGKFVLKSQVKGGARISTPANNKALNIFRIVNKHHVRLEGFDVSGAGGGGIIVSGTRNATTNTGSYEIEIVDNISHHHGKQGIWVGLGCDYILVQGNEVYYCADDGSAINSISIQLMQTQIVGGSAYVSTDTAWTIDGIQYNMIVRKNAVHECGLTTQSTDSGGIMIDQDKDNPAVTWSPVPYNKPRLVENNICYGNGGPGITALSTIGDDVMNIIIRNNVCYKNARKSGAGKMVAQLVNRASGTKWINNIAVADNSFNSVSKAICCVALPAHPHTFSNVTWRNNIAWNGVNSGATTEHNDNSSMTNAPNLPTNGVNGNQLGVDPKLVAPGLTGLLATLDFRLQAGSPAIDAGTSANGGGVADDFTGAPRTGTMDIGAYNYGSTPTTLAPNSTIVAGVYTRGTTTDIASAVALGGNFTARDSRNTPAPADWIADTGSVVQSTFPAVTKTFPANHSGAIAFAFSMKPAVIAYVGDAFANGAALTYPTFEAGTLGLRFNGHTASSSVTLTTGHARFASPFLNASPAGRRLFWERILVPGDTDTSTSGISHIAIYSHARIKVGAPVSLGTDPFAFSSGSNSVVISDTATTKAVGDVVVFAGATAAQGVTMTGAYTVTAVSTDTYTVFSPDAATGNGSGGGSGVTHALSSVKVRYSATANTTATVAAQSPGVGEWAFGNIWTRETQTNSALRTGLPAGATERIIRANTNAMIHFDRAGNGWSDTSATVASSIWATVSGILELS